MSGAKSILSKNSSCGINGSNNRRHSQTVTSAKRLSNASSGDVTGDDSLCSLKSCSKKLKNKDSLCCSACERWFHVWCLNPALTQAHVPYLGLSCIKVYCRLCERKGEFEAKQAGNSARVQPILKDESVQSGDGFIQNNVDKSVGTTIDSVNVQGHENVLSNFYHFDFKFNDKQFRSQEHAYQYERAMSQNNVQLAEKIQNAQHAGKAKLLSKDLDRSDNRDNDKTVMVRMLQAKANQLPSFRQCLRDTGQKRILHATHASDKFWGAGVNNWDTHRFQQAVLPGENVFGNMLSSLRDNLSPESDYNRVNVEVFEPENCDFVVVLTGGESMSAGSSRFLSGFRSERHNFRRDNISATARPTHGFNRPRMDSTRERHRCFHCGVPGHTHENCRYRGSPIRCFRCRKLGHKAAYCSNNGPSATVEKSSSRVFLNSRYRQDPVHSRVNLQKRSTVEITLDSSVHEADSTTSKEVASTRIDINENGITISNGNNVTTVLDESSVADEDSVVFDENEVHF